jgi:tetratricopeptide (TPR) repeat protein
MTLRLLATALVAAAGVALAGCEKDDTFYVENLFKIEQGEKAAGSTASSSRVDELKAQIKRYRAVVDKKVEASEQLGIYHKMLAVAYMRKEMYQAAYDSLIEAMRYHPTNSVLFYYAGVCAGQTSKAQAPSDRTQWLERAESHYKRAIDLDPRYVEAMYGLAVLDTFELGNVGDAEKLVRKILTLQMRHEQASFLLGNILYRTGRLPEALTVYKQLADSAQTEAARKDALTNKSRIEKEMRGTP